MAVAVLLLNSVLPFTGPWRLMLDIVIGAFTYVSMLMWLWQLCGRPDGPERHAWDLLQSFLFYTRRMIASQANSKSRQNINLDE